MLALYPIMLVGCPQAEKEKSSLLSRGVRKNGIGQLVLSRKKKISR